MNLCSPGDFEGRYFGIRPITSLPTELLCEGEILETGAAINDFSQLTLKV